MFGFFRNKEKIDPPISKISYLLARSAEMLHIQLIVCKSDTLSYEKFINEIFFTGYATGFFDATMQYFGLRPLEDEKFLKLLLIAFLHFFNGDASKASIHWERYLTNQDNHDYDAARMLGGKEYYDSMDNENAIPTGLMRKFQSTSH